MRVLSALLCCASSALVGAAMGAELRLSFPELQGEGVVRVAVFADRRGWEARRPVFTMSVTPEGGSAAAVFTDVAPGRYGVMAYLDRNRDDELNRLWIGPPTERYGFSNNSRGMFGPPNWDAASFDLPHTGAAQEIRLR